jgi:hypothetical protein
MSTLHRTLAFGLAPALAALALGSSGCLRSTTFKCDTNTDCGAGGQCEVAAGGFCSFADSSCTASGRRFGDSSGASSGKCVGEVGDDAGVGAEKPIDAPEIPSGCPGNFMTLPNSGPRGHRYLLINTQAGWTAQRDGCAAMSTFMAFPDGATNADAQLELAAVVTLAGNGVWVGVEDIVTNGAYKTSLGQPVSARTLALINPGGGNPNQQGCFTTNGTSMTDEDCADTRKTVCECVP